MAGEEYEEGGPRQGPLVEDADSVCLYSEAGRRQNCRRRILVGVAENKRIKIWLRQKRRRLQPIGEEHETIDATRPCKEKHLRARIAECAEPQRPIQQPHEAKEDA